MRSGPLPSRSLKDRLTKVPSWFRPKNNLQALAARKALYGIRQTEEMKEKRIAAMRASMLPKAADIARQYDVRAKSFLGGQLSPWAGNAWKNIQADRYKQSNPLRYFVWRITGLLGPA